MRPIPWPHRVSLLALLAVSVHAGAQQADWQVFARDDGCVDARVLLRAERLPRVPTSPEDYARMLHERGEPATIGAPPGFPPELAGKVVQVRGAQGRGVLFARGDACRALSR